MDDELTPRPSPADDEPTKTVVDPEGEGPDYKEPDDTNLNDTVVGPDGELYFYRGDEPTDDDDDDR
jgi:hypothetical protein